VFHDFNASGGDRLFMLHGTGQDHKKLGVGRNVPSILDRGSGEPSPEKTRSQTVARIADRTAKNCKGHVT